MLYRLYEAIIDNCLNEEIANSQGWIEKVEKQILPILKHPKLYHHGKIIHEGLKRVSQPISIFVVGEGKFGKSTVINALIGQGKEIAKTHFLPKTWHITKYIPNSLEERYEIYYKEEHENFERLELICREYKNIIIESGLIKLDNLPQLEEILRLEETESKTQGNSSAIWQVLQTVTSKKLNTGFELVDTPGLSQNRPGILQEETIEDFYHRADIVLWVMIADKLNSRETKESLESMSRYGKPIIGLINRADQIPEGKKELVITQVQDKFAGLLNDIILISAKQAFEAQKNNNSSLLEQSGLSSLWDKIDYFAVKNGRRNQLISIYNTSVKATEEAKLILVQEANNINKNIEIYRQNLEITSKLKNNKSFVSIIQGTANEAKQKIKNEGEKIIKATSNIEDEFKELFDEKKVKDHLQQEINFILDKMQKLIDRELQQVQDKIKINQYQEYIYEANGYIKSYRHQMAFNVDNSKLVNIKFTKLEINFWENVKIYFVKFLNNTGYVAIEFWEDIKSFFITEQEKKAKEIEKIAREKQRIRENRENELNGYIQNLDNVGEICKQKIIEATEKEIDKIGDKLQQEVKDCFAIAFISEEVMKEKCSQNLQNAANAMIPFVVIETITRELQIQ